MLSLKLHKVMKLTNGSFIKKVVEKCKTVKYILYFNSLLLADSNMWGAVRGETIDRKGQLGTNCTAWR